MEKNIILLPLFAQVFLIMIVWLWMYYTRLKEISTKKIVIQNLANALQAKELLRSVSGPSDNLVNLFEIPILFFMAIIVLYITGIANYTYLILASCYVFLRFIHSVIHITYNKVIHRFVTYFVSTVLLWCIWGKMAWDLLYKLS